MTYVNVSGGKPYQRKRVEDMIYYCINKLMPRMQKLDIEVRLKDLKGSALGYCLSLDTRTFELEIDKSQKLRNLLTTVAHEMVHVKQYARKELTEGTWQGKLLNPKQEYWDRGYEIEAHGRETGLFVRWVEDNNLCERKWTHEG
tara:strand:+ start:7453 stop:7884 length:432 start_codon:yes stop_codon:yes gene_type:complete